MLGFVGLIVSVVLFILLTFRGWNMAVASVLSSVLILLFNRMNLFKGFAESYTQGFSEFAGSWWLLFLLGTTFGRCMQDMGLSDAMARVIYARFRGRVILAVLAVSFVLSYGGIGTFVIAFTVYPIASRLFQEASISRNLLPAVMLFCPTTMCMTMLPGTPSIQNMIPTSFLGTSIYAAPLFGTAAAALTGVVGYLYFWQATAAEQPVDTGSSVAGKTKSAPADYLSFLPCICLWGIAFFMNRVGIESRTAVAVAMAAAIGVCIVLKHPSVSVQKSINEGSMQGLRTLAATSCIMGYGALVQSTEGFQLCMQLLLRISASPLLTCVIAISSGRCHGGRDRCLHRAEAPQRFCSEKHQRRLDAGLEDTGGYILHHGLWSTGAVYRGLSALYATAASDISITAADMCYCHQCDRSRDRLFRSEFTALL